MNILSTEEEEEVVGEVDIILAQPEENCDVHVLQYPLRNPYVGIGKDRKVTGVNVRPKHGRIEVNLSVFPQNVNFNSMHDENGGGRSFDTTQHLVEEKAIGEEQCLRSRPNFAPPDANYAVATFIPAEKSVNGTPSLTLVPVRSVAQMRPTFDYLDAFEAEVTKQKAAEKMARAKARGVETKQQTQEEGEVAPLQVSFRRRESERAAEKRKTSHASLRKREEEEPWVPLDFLSIDDMHALNQREKLFNVSHSSAARAVKEEAVYDEAMTYNDLYKAHTHHVRLGLIAKGNIDHENLSARALKRLPVESAVAHAINHARIVCIDELHQLVGEDKNRNEVLEAMRATAVCLRGCWVAKKGNKKGFGRMKDAAERYEASRVLILSLFRQQRVVTEHDAMEALGKPMLITGASVRTILEEVADEKRGVGWEFRLDDDAKFIIDHHELCRAQDNEWEQRKAAATRILSTSGKR